jgi:hypothetical protein
LVYYYNGPIRPKDAFASSLKMFEYIKKALKRCKQFSTGFTYLALSKEFRICLHNYAGMFVCMCVCVCVCVTNMLVRWCLETLKFRCPNPVSTAGSAPGRPPIYDLSKEDEAKLCHIINTGAFLNPQMRFGKV